jgi:hypothetical protein
MRYVDADVTKIKNWIRSYTMFRKLTIIICLISFCPAAVGAQELAAVAGSQVVAEQTTEKLPNKEMNLSLPVNKYPTDKLVSADNRNASDAVKSEEPKKEKSSGMTFKEWADIHWSNYRWVWWAGAAAALVALHVFAFSDHK